MKFFFVSRDVFLSGDLLKKNFSELYVSEIVWLSLVAAKESSWKCNTELNPDLWSPIDSSGSSSAYWSVFCLVSPLCNPNSLDSAVGEPLHRSSQRWKRLQRFYLSLFWHPVLRVYLYLTQICFITKATSFLVKRFAGCRNCSSSPGGIIETNFPCIFSCFSFTFS